MHSTPKASSDATIKLTQIKRKHAWFKADFIVYHKDKPNWDFMDASIKAFEGMPEYEA
ncbi:MAG: hypothetical protein V3U75_09075 [Methylococcaceae bacterium]